MKLIGLILGISLFGMLSLASSSVYPGDPPKKKVYRDTIYRFAKKPTTTPVAKSPKPTVAKSNPVVKNSPKKLNLPLRISSAIKQFKVKKSENKMYVFFGDTFKVFRISLGANPVGHKTRQGDNKTPEGIYKITYKNPKSRGYKSLRISYPNSSDVHNARKIGANPGGDIVIHGLWWSNQDPINHWKDNWTRGCIAVNNQEIDEIYQYTSVDTEIAIWP